MNKPEQLLAAALAIVLGLMAFCEWRLWQRQWQEERNWAQFKKNNRIR